MGGPTASRCLRSFVLDSQQLLDADGCIGVHLTLELRNGKYHLQERCDPGLEHMAQDDQTPKKSG